MPWSDSYNIDMKPQEEEIDRLHWMDEDEILEDLKNCDFLVTPTTVQVFEEFIEFKKLKNLSWNYK